MESKKKNLIIGVVVILCVIVVAVGGFFAYNQFFAPQPEVTEEEVLEVDEPELYEVDGYADYDTWMANLTAKKDSYVGFAEQKIADLDGYLTDEQKEELRQHEAAIAEAATLTDIVLIEEQINEIVIPAQEQKDADIAAAEEAAAAQVTYTEPTYNYSNSYSGSNSGYTGNYTSGVLNAYNGVNYYNGRKETYYNLDMSGVIANAQNMGINGNYWVRDDGVKMYGDYVIVASQDAKGTIVDTSLGTGIVLDYCVAGTTDIATTW